MNNILVIGANGMLGHTLLRYLSNKKDVILTTTTRNNLLKINNVKYITNIDILKNSFEEIIHKLKPNFVVNCAGVIKHSKEMENISNSIYINSFFPHHIAKICDSVKSKLIHISTDCVFSGSIGYYNETSLHDATDIYGKSKSLGEVGYGNHLTIRTSIIGHELKNKNSFLEWFLNSKESVNGYTNAYYSGVTTLELSKIIYTILLKNDIAGIYNIAGEFIDKCSLLNIIKKIYNINTKIVPDDSFFIDRSLNCNNFINETGFIKPKWDNMILEMKEFEKEYGVKNDIR